MVEIHLNLNTNPTLGRLGILLEQGVTKDELVRNFTNHFVEAGL